MIFKNKALKTTAAAIAIFSMVATGSMSYVHADNSYLSEGVSIERALADNKYDINYKVIYVNADGVAEPDNTTGAGHALMTLDGTTYKMEIKDGKAYVTVKFNSKMHGMMNNYKFVIDGKEANYTQNGATYTIELPSINSTIDVSMYVPMMGREVRFLLAPNGELSTEKVLKDGSYPAQNDVKYIGDGNAEIGNNMARKVLAKDSVIKVKDGKINTTLTFTEGMYNMLEDFKVKVDGKSVQITENKTDRTISFDMPKVDSKIEVSLMVTMMGREVSFATILDTQNVEYDEVVVQAPGEQQPPVDDSDSDNNESDDNNSSDNNTGSGDNNGSNDDKVESDGSNSGNGSTGTLKPDSSTNNQSGTIKNGTYTVKNNVEYVGTGNAELGNSMARKVLGEYSKIVAKDGKITATLNFTEDQYDFIENFRVKVDGKDVKVTVDKSNRTISFEMPSIDSEVLVTINVSIMGRDVSFKTTFDKSTLVFGDNTANNGNGSSNNTNNSTDNSTTADSESNKVESTVKKGKLYTIKNTVSHSSQTGKEMARKYLNSTSKVEIIDGQTYVTLTFTGSSFMKNHAIYVNGSKVSHTVVAKSGDSISLRFKVSDLSDSIKVGLYVIPMSRNIEFGVTLLEDTLTFVKDFDLNEDGTLPQTGSLIDSNIAIGAGSAMMAVAGILGRRKRK